MPRRTSEPTWTTRDGQRLKITEMTDSHLVNTIRFLERLAEARYAGLPLASFQGEMANWLEEQDWYDGQTRDVGELAEMLDPRYAVMVAEAECRGLTW